MSGWLPQNTKFTGLVYAKLKTGEQVRLIERKDWPERDSIDHNGFMVAKHYTLPEFLIEHQSGKKE